MQPENLFQDSPVEQRAEMLKGMAMKVDVDKVRRHYDMDEKDQIKDFIADESVVLMETEEEFGSIKKDFNLKIKKKKKEIITALKDIKRGYSENNEEIYLIDDQENGMMNYFDKNGIFIQSRPLMPSEKQTTILKMENTGTDN